MIRLDRMLMIGSTGANVGKTELACAIIRKFCKSNPLVGIKVTTIQARDGRCPRGGMGCGVCSSIAGNFLITEETDRTLRKDTARLLAAGARRVFWLRVIRAHLEEALAALLEVIGSDAVLICESNSLREVAEPGLFLMVGGRRQEGSKESARKVAELADKFVASDGSGFDFDIGRVKLVEGKWAMRLEATAIIMAGGGSTRAGQDKSMLPIDGEPMIGHVYDRLSGHFDQVIVSANDPSKYGFLGVEVVADRVMGRGPLMGIASALRASTSEVNFVIACDIPTFDMGLVRRLLREAGDHDAVIPRTGQGQYEPLFAVYKKSAVDSIEEALSSGKTRVMEGLEGCKVKYVEVAADERPRNINTMADYREFIERQKYADVRADA
ncbi:MAG TPA: molybdenum cofactor guanylyltransferase [Sedimentisphaerales bacterium]|nr:molybdenum cofactor guanylyltransferase [Sedimentisphaerales bacterium]